MSIELVIARYNEDILWLNKVKNKIITVYNKGEDNINKKFKAIPLPNIGRESHTYLTHIINNYDNLADLTIFSQGDPFFHSPDFLKLIKNTDLFQPVQPLTYYYSPSLEMATKEEKNIIIKKDFRKNGMPPTQVLDIDKELWIKDLKIYVEYYNKDGEVMYPVYYHDYFILGFIKHLKKKFKFNNILQFMKERYKLTNINLKYLVPMSYAAIFAVKKEVILSRKKEFYENILKLLIDDFNIYNEDTGLLLERLWLSIFNYQKYNKYYKKLNEKNFSINYYEIIPINSKIKFLIKTISPIFIILSIDSILYNLIIGYNNIILVQRNNSKFKFQFNKPNIIKQNEFITINIILKNNLYVYIDNNIIVNKKMDGKKIEFLKIEKTFEDIILVTK
jgi:hypothetical protein